VLRAVVLEDALDVLELADQHEVAEEDGEPDAAFDEVEREALDAEAIGDAVVHERGDHDEDRGEQREGDAHRDAHRLRRDALLLGDLALGRPRERLEPE
jgi:hypothetical protein